MTTFLSLQQNSLVSYKPNKENKITNPINLSPNEIKLFSILKEIIEYKIIGCWRLGERPFIKYGK